MEPSSIVTSSTKSAQSQGRGFKVAVGGMGVAVRVGGTLVGKIAGGIVLVGGIGVFVDAG